MTINSLLYIFIPLIAFLYASVGFGGATGYLAVMTIFGISPQIVANSALVLNILVAGISFASYYRAGYFRRNLLFPFLIMSLPAAFVGGFVHISDETYKILLYLALTVVAIRMLFFSRENYDQSTRKVSLPLALILGLVIGLLSGMVGIGGGIFLSPIIILARWGTPKEASAVAAAFIFINSASGLVGRFSAGTFFLDGFSLSLLPFGVAGAVVGSYYGAIRLSGAYIRRGLGVVMSLAVVNFWVTYWS